MSADKNPTRSTFVVLVGFCAVLAIVIAGGFWWVTRSNDALAGETLDAFPTLDRSTLSQSQSELLATLEKEWESGAPGTTYAEGVEESWCADFVSWNMNIIGMPYSNPNSGSWRIPGVYTLQEYYESVGTFVPLGQDYRLKTGDTILYDDSSPFGQHVNIVLRNDAGIVTTVGGNENNSVMLHRFNPDDVAGIVGFGSF